MSILYHLSDVSGLGLFDADLVNKHMFWFSVYFELVKYFPLLIIK